MTNEMTTWSRIIKNLETILTDSVYRTWFTQVSLKKIDNKTAIIEVPNKFIANWLRDNYINEIRKSFQSVINRSPNIQIEYKNRKLKKQSNDMVKDESIRTQRNNLDRAMTFDQFIVGDSNRFAFSSALKVANKPSNFYNPLYIFSKSSFGKTHLLNSIGNHITNEEPNKRIEYISSSDFISYYNRSIGNNTIHKFKDRYINVTAFLFDDIQLLSNKKRLQEEFLSIFDVFYEQKRQIVITGDRSPNMLRSFNPHIKSRLGSGLITEILSSDDDIKINIIKNNIKKENIDIPDDIIIFLAKYSNNYKYLMNNIVRLGTYTSMNNGNINLSMVKSLLKSNNKLSIRDIQSITSGYFNISVSELVSYNKKRIYSYPRQLAMYLTKKNTDLSFKEIGTLFGDRDHSTVIYAIKQIEKNKLQNKTIRDDIKNLNRLLV